MSEFHGGYWIERTDDSMLEPARIAARDYIAKRVGTAGDSPTHLRVATLGELRFVHVSFAGGEADGKGRAFFHREHGALGADLARATGARVHAYHYENQVGVEGVETYDPDGRQVHCEDAEWDEFARAQGIDEYDELMAVLPLGQLAGALGVGRTLLDQTIPYDGEYVETSLEAPFAPDALTALLRRVPLAPVAAPANWRPQLLFFPASWIAEIHALAARLRVTEGAVLATAFEVAGPELWPGESTPKALRLLMVPAAAPSAPALDSGDKQSIRVQFPDRVLQDAQVRAVTADSSLSRIFHRAYDHARARLLMASRPT
jgi:hypothetical protein